MHGTSTLSSFDPETCSSLLEPIIAERRSFSPRIRHVEGGIPRRYLFSSTPHSLSIQSSQFCTASPTSRCAVIPPRIPHIADVPSSWPHLSFRKLVFKPSASLRLAYDITLSRRKPILQPMSAGLRVHLISRQCLNAPPVATSFELRLCAGGISACMPCRGYASTCFTRHALAHRLSFLCRPLCFCGRPDLHVVTLLSRASSSLAHSAL